MPAEPAAKAIIFDVEGTLIDCARETIACWHETLASLEIDAPADTLQLLSGLDGDDLVKTLAPDADDTTRRAIIKAQGKRYKRLSAFSPSGPHVGQLLERLRKNGRRLALATTLPRGAAFLRPDNALP